MARDGGCCNQQRRLVDGQKGSLHRAEPPQHQSPCWLAHRPTATNSKSPSQLPMPPRPRPTTTPPYASVVPRSLHGLPPKKGPRRIQRAHWLPLPAKPLQRALPRWCSLPLDRFHLPRVAWYGLVCASVIAELADSVAPPAPPARPAPLVCLLGACRCWVSAIDRSTRWMRAAQAIDRNGALNRSTNRWFGACQGKGRVVGVNL